jgi:hypothetical protein
VLWAYYINGVPGLIPANGDREWEQPDMATYRGHKHPFVGAKEERSRRRIAGPYSHSEKFIKDVLDTAQINRYHVRAALSSSSL